jgi:hypothetical protein
MKCPTKHFHLLSGVIAGRRNRALVLKVTKSFMYALVSKLDEMDVRMGRNDPLAITAPENKSTEWVNDFTGSTDSAPSRQQSNQKNNAGGQRCNEQLKETHQ